MIYIIDITIPTHQKYGSVYTTEVALPSKIHRIRGVLGSVTLGSDTALTLTSDNEPESVQPAVFSLSVNNTDVICANTPLCVINNLRKSGYKHNLTHIDNISVIGGSLARIVIEERHYTPFSTETNEYTAKIYLDYD